MPNLMLTNYCNCHCSYCFGVDMMAPAKPAVQMSRETFNDILAWLDKVPFDRVMHLMGGEPTLHPDIEKIVEELLDRDLHVTIFSNMASDQAPVLAEKFAGLPVKWVANVNHPSRWTPQQEANIRRALKAGGRAVSLSVNILPELADDSWVIDLIREYDLDRNIKVGFVLPTLNSSNQALEDDQYRVVADRLVDLVKAGEEIGLSAGYECGVPYCVFTDEQTGYLWRHKSYINSGCMSRLDITPEGNLIYCLPLATAYHPHFSEFETYPEARDWFERKYAPYRKLCSKVECAECMLNNPVKCNGGCMAKNMQGAHNVKFD